MDARQDVGSPLVRDALITFVVVVIAVMALDDITTDSAVSFPVERTALTGCALWFFLLAVRLWRRGRPVLGAVSFGLVTIGVLAHPAIGSDTVLARGAYLATVAGLTWFLIVAAVLGVSARRTRRSLTA